MKLPIIYALAALLALLPDRASSQERQRHPSSLLEIVSEHDRRISRLEADVVSLRGQRPKTSIASTTRDLDPDPLNEIYRVKPGESLGQIARRNGISTTELARINGIKNPDQIEVGQLIQFPNSHLNVRSHSKKDPHTHHPEEGANSASPAFQGPVAIANDQSQNSTTTQHTVGKGDTLFKIASTYGISISDLREANGLFTDHIHVGQRLRIPNSDQGVFVSHPTSPSPPPQSATHIVKKQETSVSIARQYGISVDDLARANNLKNPNQIFVGQSLQIPSGAHDYPLDLGLGQNGLDGNTPAAPPRSDHFATYRVRKGDTVTAIAREFEISPQSILDANKLGPDGGIRVGQEIKIPVDQFWATLSSPR